MGPLGVAKAGSRLFSSPAELGRCCFGTLNVRMKCTNPGRNIGRILHGDDESSSQQTRITNP
eukprot:1497861-Pyramimonas_sp.AAC.1